jgi:hypothetical protein
MIIYNVLIKTNFYDFEKEETLYLTYNDEYRFYWFGRLIERAEQFLSLESALKAYTEHLAKCHRLIGPDALHIIKKDHLDETNILGGKIAKA